MVRETPSNSHFGSGRQEAALYGSQDVVGAAANGGEAVDLWRKHRPDVALLDLRMPTLDGVGAIEQIRNEDATARVIMLRTFETDNVSAPRSFLFNITTKVLVDSIQTAGIFQLLNL